MRNIELFYFPPNTTSLIQPLDQGIIKIFKDYYKKCLSTSMNFDLSNNVTQKEWCKNVDMYQSMVWISKAWNNLSSTTISNYFTKSLENAYVKKLVTECDDFLCFEINPKIDEQLLFDLAEKHKKENSEELESNDEAGKCAKKLERYFQINFPDKTYKIWESIDDIQKEKISR